MAKKLIIVMVNTDPRNGEELGAPFFQATVAAAMDYEVDVVCTATAGQLMKKGVAEKEGEHRKGAPLPATPLFRPVNPTREEGASHDSAYQAASAADRRSGLGPAGHGLREA